MNKLYTADYIPSNLRELPLYKEVEALFDRVLQNSFYSTLEGPANFYNVTSSVYDPDKIINMLGGEDFYKLLGADDDKKSVSLLVSRLYNLKGTNKGLEYFLRTLNIDYKEVVYSKSGNGCTSATIVLKKGYIDPVRLASIELLSKLIFPICITLTGITNCSGIADIITSTGPNIQLGLPLLDFSTVLGVTKLGYGLGSIDPRISDEINVLLCNTFVNEIDVSSLYSIDSVFNNVHDDELVYNRNWLLKLDYGLVLGKNTKEDLLPWFASIQSKLIFSEMWLRDPNSYTAYASGSYLVDSFRYGFDSEFYDENEFDTTLTRINPNDPILIANDDVLFHGRRAVCHNAVILGWYNFNEAIDKPLDGHRGYITRVGGLGDISLGDTFLDEGVVVTTHVSCIPLGN